MDNGYGHITGLLQAHFRIICAGISYLTGLLWGDPRKVPEQHQEHSCVLNKQAALARTAHRPDEASMLSETSVPRLQNLVLMPSICVSIAFRELDGLACPFHSLVGSGHL